MPPGKFKGGKRKSRNWAANRTVQSIPRLNHFPLQIARTAVHECQWRFHNGNIAADQSAGSPIDAVNQFIRVSLNSLFHYPHGYLNGAQAANSVTPGQDIRLYMQHAPLLDKFPTASPNAYNWIPEPDLKDYPATFAGIFDYPTSPGNVYQKYCVIGCKITLVFIPQRPDLTGNLNPNQQQFDGLMTPAGVVIDPVPPDPKVGVTQGYIANQHATALTTIPSMFYTNIQNLPLGGQLTQSQYWDEIKDRPRTVAQRVEGNYSLAAISATADGIAGVDVVKKSKQVAQTINFNPRQTFSYDTVADAEKLWGNTGTGVQRQTGTETLVASTQGIPEDHAIAAIGIVPLFPAPNTAGVSGILQMKIEKTILFKDPYVLTTAARLAQADAPGMDQAAGNLLPQSTLYRAGSTLGAGLSMMHHLYQ